jgi:phosphatidylglycerol:prolipoprotein diacylglycerol transferase
MVSGSRVLADQYIHNLDPVALDIFGLSIRWYGIAYVLGFFAGYLILHKLAKAGKSILGPEETSDFITYSALFGVMVGGRLGYMLLYDFENFASNPLIFFNLRSGGMASHGGIAGLALFTLYYAYRKKLNWPALGDSLVVVAPLGIGFGRLANFVNGELWGKKCAPDLAWGVRFPTELSVDHLGPEVTSTIASPGQGKMTMDYILDIARGDPELLQKLGAAVDPRHPSQLYQAAMEGFLLFGILITTRLVFKRLPHGLLTAMFFIFYAVFRITGEVYREPDLDKYGEAKKFLGNLSAGQYYSLYMIAAGLAFLFYAFRYGRKAAAKDASTPPNDKPIESNNKASD